ncbi:MAG: T9SS type A sorting domain-containing protein [candidate division KSB1 bacterium]|nr:T9SS type A sorting domain-containing protein [candidate division KSB1 bacterium]MDZ7365791.1 T9SS type A sorting domain-containing protein [candidate division KSB1 bacterium]MDZ7403730.1 T9SS type A sorting domain-containing protein [candidate division KSB1 bacterium]
MKQLRAKLVVFFLLAAVSADAGSGGPDNFGYKWKDSDEAGGPSFNYINISSSGTPVSGLGDDNFVGPFPIGFSFSFYGKAYTEFYIGSNGLIGFGSTAGLSAFTNRVIPTDFTPNNIVAWLWDDLIPRDDTGVYYQNFSDKLVIQFVQYGSRAAANERVNAEVILYNTGRIVIQYASFTANWPLNSATVGLENGDGADGLNVVYNAAYLRNALAIRFSTNAMIPETPVLFSPGDGVTNQPTSPTLYWNAADGAMTYRLQIATDALFHNVVLDDSTITAKSKAVGPLAYSKTFYWRVKAKNATGASAWSSFRKFSTQNDPLLGGAIAPITKSGFRKSNQSKVFYYDGQWWAIALNETNTRWQIWRYNGASWTVTNDVQAGAAYYCDAVLNESGGKLLVFGSHKSTPFFRRFSYAAGAWKLDAGYPVILSDFTNPDQENPVSLVRAKNGELWIFRINNKTLQARRSRDGGKTWEPRINVKTGLTTSNGTTDAVAFSVNGSNYVGVAYAECHESGSKFGFLYRRDSEPATSWTDESAALKFFGNERACNQLCLAVDASNNLYFFTHNAGFIGRNPRNTLYKRAVNGVWQKFKVNSTMNWKTPAVAIDEANNRLYFLGVNNNTLHTEYKTCLIGQEAALDTAAAQTLFHSSGDHFSDVSVPAANVNAVSGLMVCGDNVSADDIQFRHFPLGSTAPLIVGAVHLSNSEANAGSAYTIPLTLSNAGALKTGSLISMRFSNNTFVPDAIAPGEISVNGTPVPAGGIISNSGTRQITIISPVNLSNNQTFSIVINAGAGLLNPMNAGSYRVTVWTSSQPAPVSSPNYNIEAATTSVTPATVTLSVNALDTPSDYLLNFNLGNQGRLSSGNSTITIKFNSASGVTQGVLHGVTVNGTKAAAVGDESAKKITVTVPAAVNLGNNAGVTLFVPSPIVRNPRRHGNYTLSVATSVETAEVVSEPYEIPLIAGRPIPNAAKDFDRANQSKMFYHGGAWWLTAQAKDDTRWYLWKFDGTAWEKTILLYSSSKVRPDCILDGLNNKAFMLLPGGSTTYFLRLSFAGGNWTIDPGYPTMVPDFAQESDHGINLARAYNGNLWVFRIKNAKLTAKRSTNAGQTWSSEIIIKSGLNKDSGLTDAVAFTFNGSNYLGLGYAENSTKGSIYGFLRHKDSDANTVWTDETAAIPQFAGTTSDDHLNMVEYNGTILMVVKTNGGSASTVHVALLRRAPDGKWFQHPIIMSSGWTRPLLVIDASHDMLYVFGTRENAPKVGEMKRVALGAYDDLLAAPIDTIFANSSDSFFDASVPAHPVDDAMNLLICNGNQTRNELWYRLLNLSGTAKANPAAALAANSVVDENLEGVAVFPNPFNPQTTFRFHVAGHLSVKLQIFNLAGQLVRTLVDGDLPKGMHQRRWNGQSDAGQRVASGLYFYRLQIGEKMFRGKVRMIK